MLSDPTGTTEKRIWAPASLFSFLEGYATLDGLEYAFHTTHPVYAYVVSVAGKASAYSHEWPTYGVKQRDPDLDGL